MCQCVCHDPDLDPPYWLRAAVTRVWTYRAAVVRSLLTLVLLAVWLVASRFRPSDMERAEGDLHRAWAVIQAVEEEEVRQRELAACYREAAKFNRQRLDEEGASAPQAWMERARAMVDVAEQLYAASKARRENLLRLSADYRRLAADAECEIARAKDARDRGTPYEVAPRVRGILAPVLAPR